MVDTQRKSPDITQIRGFVNKMGQLFDSERAFTYMISDFYAYLADTYYIEINFYPDELLPYQKYLEEYETYKAGYDTFMTTHNERIAAVKNIVSRLSSI